MPKNLICLQKSLRRTKAPLRQHVLKMYSSALDAHYNGLNAHWASDIYLGPAPLREQMLHILWLEFGSGQTSAGMHNTAQKAEYYV